MQSIDKTKQIQSKESFIPSISRSLRLLNRFPLKRWYSERVFIFVTWWGIPEAWLWTLWLGPNSDCVYSSTRTLKQKCCNMDAEVDATSASTTARNPLNWLGLIEILEAGGLPSCLVNRAVNVAFQAPALHTPGQKRHSVDGPSQVLTHA